MKTKIGTQATSVATHLGDASTALASLLDGVDWVTSRKDIVLAPILRERLIQIYKMLSEAESDAIYIEEAVKFFGDDDGRHFPTEDGKRVGLRRDQIVEWYLRGSASTKADAYDERVLLDRVDVTLRPDPEFDAKEVVTILCEASAFKAWAEAA